jgi:protein-tyrosine phosphatase
MAVSSIRSIQPSQAAPEAPKAQGVPNQPDSKVQAVSKSRIGIGDFISGVVHSRLFSISVLVGLTVGALKIAAAVFGLAFLMSNPIGWIIAGGILGGFAVALLVCLKANKGFQKISFEFSALARIFKAQTYHQIRYSTGRHGKIFLGSLPNRLCSDADVLIEKERVKTVLSVNEHWETKPFGLSEPYSRKSWKRLGIEHRLLIAKDHALLNEKQLDAAAEVINERLKHGNIYVHCRAGVGRSAMAVAAYLIKYEGKTVDQACRIIRSSRPISTIHKKKATLNRFYQSLNAARSA